LFDSILMRKSFYRIGPKIFQLYVGQRAASMFSYSWKAFQTFFLIVASILYYPFQKLTKQKEKTFRQILANK
jgi:ATP/ADP translocase